MTHFKLSYSDLECLKTVIQAGFQILGRWSSVNFEVIMEIYLCCVYPAQTLYWLLPVTAIAGSAHL